MRKTPVIKAGQRGGWWLRRGGAAGIVAVLLVAGAPGLAAADGSQEVLLDELQRTAFQFFWSEANPANGLIRDRNASWSPCSIASVGFGLSAIVIGIDHGWVTREAGRDRVLTTLETLWNGPQGSGAAGFIGYKGLYYHFLDMNFATRTWDCELSTIDTALLFAGIIDCKQYFSTPDPLDEQVRALADSITYRADWQFMTNGGPAIRMGWKPGTGFSGFGNWIGYNEAMILYILAIGSPTFPVSPNTWNAWTSGYNWSTQYGQSYVIFPPLFGHQYSHCWIDFRNIQDAYMRGRGITYFENSRRATLAQQAYCIANPFGWTGYGANVWGITASDTPTGYRARGAPPPQSDDGTIAPTAVGGAVPFAPEIAIPTLEHFYDTYRPQLWSTYGFKDAFNLTQVWWATDYIGIDEGPIIVMIENYRNQSVWNRFMANPDVQRGLELAGFTTATGIEVPGPVPPVTLALEQNSPNPFGAETTIPYTLAAPGRVSLVLYDVEGRLVRTLVEEVQPAGNHEAQLGADGLPNGVYYYRLEANGFETGRRCVIIR